MIISDIPITLCVKAVSKRIKFKLHMYITLQVLYIMDINRDGYRDQIVNMSVWIWAIEYVMWVYFLQHVYRYYSLFMKVLSGTCHNGCRWWIINKSSGFALSRFPVSGSVAPAMNHNYMERTWRVMENFSDWLASATCHHHMHVQMGSKPKY